MALVIAMTSNKGGTGKTTTTLGLGSALAQQGKRILLIDLDQQGNLTTGSGQECPLDFHVAAWLLQSENRPVSFEQVVVRGTSGIDLIPSGQPIIHDERQLDATRGCECNLDDLLQPIRSVYDYILIDCPPNMGIMTYLALIAADFYIVPMQGENFAFLGLDAIQRCVLSVRKTFRSNVQLAGIVLNKFRANTRFGQAIYQRLQESEVHVFTTRIRQCLSLMECTADGESIFEYDPTSTGAEDFLALATELQTTLKHG